jgi:hypothetical protein
MIARVVKIDTSGADRLMVRFRKIANPDPTPLLIRWAALMDLDNRQGVLAGLDRNDYPLAPVTYRPVSAKTGKLVKRGAALTVAQRLGQSPTTKRGRSSRIGSGELHANNNLTTAEYRLLGGPPLAPRKQFSRVITNYTQSRPIRTGPRRWEVVGAWVNVLSKKGVPFLTFHFNGIGQKVRDLRGIRPGSFTAIRKTTREFLISIVRQRG